VTDVAVIGAGPAGSTAARLLAREGLGVLLFEQSRWPRVKPCGGAVTTRAVPLLPEGFSGLVESSPPVFRIGARDGEARVVASTPYCHTVRRVNFDEWLWESALAAGAEGHAGERVEHLEAIHGGYAVRTSRGTYRARFVIGADGAKGMTARWLGLRTAWRGAALEIEGPVAAAVYDRFRDACLVEPGGIPWGYAWVIPKGEGILNVGVGSFRPKGLGLTGLLAAYVARRALPAGPVLAHPLPFRWRSTPLSRDGVYLVGDAGAVMDPFSAEGIYHALVTGTWAAEAVREAADRGGTAYTAYEDRLRAGLWPAHREASRMARLYYPLAGFWGHVFLRDQTLLRQYLAVAAGDSTYRDLVAATLKSLMTHRGSGLWQRRLEF
jgi:geranylgeranyl reductase family protein